MEEQPVKTHEQEMLEYTALLKSEWSSTFEMLQRNRLILGAYRYGKIGPEKPKYDYTGAIITRIKKYQQTGNAEHLVDVANLCLLEFEARTHPNFHFSDIPADEQDLVMVVEGSNCDSQ